MPGYYDISSGVRGDYYGYAGIVLINKVGKGSLKKPVLPPYPALPPALTPALTLTLTLTLPIFY